MKHFIILFLFIVLISFNANSQGYDSRYQIGNIAPVKHSDPLYGLSPNPWEHYSTTGAAAGERVSTPWNQTTFYPTPPTDKYIGGKTTWNTASGQTEMAPEVNIYNMLVMTDHLRSLGYEIPAGFDDGLRRAPAHLHQKMMSSLDYLSKDQGEPITKSTSAFIRIFERETGFSLENLMGTSLKVLGNEQ